VARGSLFSQAVCDVHAPAGGNSLHRGSRSSSDSDGGDRRRVSRGAGNTDAVARAPVKAAQPLHTISQRKVEQQPQQRRIQGRTTLRAPAASAADREWEAILIKIVNWADEVEDAIANGWVPRLPEHLQVPAPQHTVQHRWERGFRSGQGGCCKRAGATGCGARRGGSGWGRDEDCGGTYSALGAWLAPSDW
jgi:hypothetical protein